MLENYSDHRPGTTLTQILAPADTPATPELMACAVGPRFLLNRFGKENIPTVAFNAAGQMVDYQVSGADGIPEALDLSAHTVDMPSLKVYGLALEAVLATFASGFKVPDLAEPNVIKINTNMVAGSGLNAAFHSRSTQVGDIVYCQGVNNGTIYRRTVVALRGTVSGGTFGADVAGTDGNAGNSSSNPVTGTASATQILAPAGWSVGCTNPGAFNGLARGARNINAYGEEFIITVNAGGTAGFYQVETATVLTDASGAGNASVVVTAAGLAGSPLTVPVAVANNDSAITVASKIRDALNAIAAITNLFSVTGLGSNVVLTRLIPVANDATLNISITNDTCTGLTAAPTSANTTAGVASTATVNISSASGRYSATSVATTPDGSAYTYTITDANANGELGGVSLLITPPSTELLVTGQTFRIRVLGNYTRLGTAQAAAGGTYTGLRDTTYMVRVVRTNTTGLSFTGAQVAVSDTAGVDESADVVDITDGVAINLGGLGLTFVLAGVGNMPPQAGLRVGDVYYIHAKAGVASTTSFDSLVLSGPAVDTLTFTDSSVSLNSVDFRLPFTGSIASTDASDSQAWTSSPTTGVQLAAGLSTYVQGRSSGNEWCAFANNVGKVGLSYRAFVLTTDTSTLVEVISAAELLAAAGPADMDNELGYAAQQMFLGSGGKPIAILNTGGSDAASYVAALATIANTSAVYDLCVLGDPTVWDDALTHVVTASSPINMHFRRMRVAIDSPGSYPVLKQRADTTNFTATISPYGSGNKLVTIVAGADEASLTTLGLVAGDLVKLTATAQQFEIDSVLSDTELVLRTGPDATVNPAVTVQIWKADTVASQKAYLRNLATSMGDRRASLVWIERGQGLVNGAVTTIPAKFGAAYISGLRSNLLPQIGMTNQPVPVYSSAPRMYSRYSEQDLNEIASYGIQIITQDDKSGTVRIRHQCTTDTSNGILNFEETTTVRLDVFSFRLEAAMDVDVGKVGTTEDYVATARSKALSICDASRQVPVGANYGPLIDDFNNLTVARSTQFLDRIVTKVNTAIGPPLNRQDIEVTAYGTLPAALA